MLRDFLETRPDYVDGLFRVSCGKSEELDVSLQAEIESGPFWSNGRLDNTIREVLLAGFRCEGDCFTLENPFDVSQPGVAAQIEKLEASLVQGDSRLLRRILMTDPDIKRAWRRE